MANLNLKGDLTIGGNLVSVGGGAPIELIAENSTYATGTYNLTDGYKFSDYNMLHFIFYSSSDLRYRCYSIPTSAFVKCVNFSLTDNTANTARYMDFGYASDTSYTIGSNEWVEFRAIYGQRI